MSELLDHVRDSIRREFASGGEFTTKYVCSVAERDAHLFEVHEGEDPAKTRGGVMRRWLQDECRKNGLCRVRPGVYKYLIGNIDSETDFAMLNPVFYADRRGIITIGDAKMSEDNRFWADWFPGETQKVFISRDIAALLCSNRGDNVGRFSPSQEKSHIDEFADSARTGNLPGTNNIPPSHHGLLIGENDALLDGYHRCAGIVLTGIGATMYVTYEPSVKSVHELRVDFGKPRSAEFVLGIPKQLRQLATTALSVVGGKTHLHNVERLAKGMQADYDAWRFCDGGRSGPGTRSSSIRLPLLVHRHNGTASVEYLETIFKAFKDNDPRALPPYPFSFWQQFSKGRVARWGGGGRPIASRAYRAFTEKLSQLSRVQVKDDGTTIREFKLAIEKAYGPHLPPKLTHSELVELREFKKQNFRRPWTTDEYGELERLAKERFDARFIADRLDRSIGAIRQKAFDRGISLDTRA